MYPSLVEVDRSGIGLDPSSVEVIEFVFGYGPYPSSVEVDCGCNCLGGIERGVRYSYSGLEILHGGVGGDVELGARTSKHILLLAIDPLSL